MNGPLSIAACAIIAAAGVWLFGGFLLRACGALLAVGGLTSTALTGSPGMAIAAILGGVAWLAGQWLFAPPLLPLAARPPRLSPMAARPV